MSSFRPRGTVSASMSVTKPYWYSRLASSSIVLVAVVIVSIHRFGGSLPRRRRQPISSGNFTGRRGTPDVLNPAAGGQGNQRFPASVLASRSQQFGDPALALEQIGQGDPVELRASSVPGCATGRAGRSRVVEHLRLGPGVVYSSSAHRTAARPGPGGAAEAHLRRRPGQAIAARPAAHALDQTGLAQHREHLGGVGDRQASPRRCPGWSTAAPSARASRNRHRTPYSSWAVIFMRVETPRASIVRCRHYCES